MFAYCGNLPTSRVDYIGTGWVGALFGAFTGFTAALITGGNAIDILYGTIVGAADGGVAYPWGIVISAVGAGFSAYWNGADIWGILSSAAIAGLAASFNFSSVLAGTASGEMIDLINGILGIGPTFAASALIEGQLSSVTHESNQQNTPDNSSTSADNNSTQSSTYGNGSGGGYSFNVMMLY